MKKVIYIILLVYLTTYSLKVYAQNNVSSATKTVVVNGHTPLFMDPIIPQDHTGQICPQIIYRNGERTYVGGWYKVYAFYWVLDVPTFHPFAVFGVNGEKNAPVILTYTTHFLYPNDITCNGGWAEGTWNFNAFTAKVPLPGSGMAGSGSDNTCKLRGYSPTPSRPDLGGLWVAAFVSDITAGPSAKTGDNQLIFTLTAAYNF